MKIINDPVHGFVNLDDPLALRLLSHPWVQRMRRIRQLGLGSLVYPGAQHTRLQHSLGAYYLMQLALDTLQAKGVDIGPGERTGALAAILLHDIGHGPFSHALEGGLADAPHEDITRLAMGTLDRQTGGALADALTIFDAHCRPFLHQLLDSQLDTDRLDYLKRDSFFSGVVEGTIGAERIVKMLTVTPAGQLAVEAKGIYTIEAFLVARRLMYWQVYLHKTVVAAERMLRAAVARARTLAERGELPPATPSLDRLISKRVTANDMANDPGLLDTFMDLDDDDVAVALKAWRRHPDPVLALLATGLVDRHLFRIDLQPTPFEQDDIDRHVDQAARQLHLDAEQAATLVMTGSVGSTAYSDARERINIVLRGGRVVDISDASDMMRLGTLERPDRRYFLCRPRLNDPNDSPTLPFGDAIHL